MTPDESSTSNPSVQHDGEHAGSGPSYMRFYAMIATSAVAMFVLMYLNSYDIVGHAWLSETRFFMTMIMAGSMTAVMMSFMLGMYRNRAANLATFLFAALLLVAGVTLVRSQVTVSGVDYMEGMIPHHSIAILTSERAGIEDVRVRELADEIIAAQLREIDEMEWLIDDIRSNGIADTSEEAAERPVPDFSAGAEPADPREAVASVVDAFHSALAAGDSAEVRRLLHDDARILEGGGAETVAEYTAGHLSSDIAFARAVTRERSDLEVHVEGDLAWTTSTSRSTGNWRGREIDSRGAELMLLERTADGWRIRSISWS